MSLLSTLRFIASHPLNAGARWSALVGYAKWQVGSRLIPGEVACNWVNASRFLARPGETGITGNLYTGLHEFADMGFLLHVLRPDDLFVDVGANVGSYSILACAAVGARGYAFEPVPATYRRLIENLRLNHLESRVVARNIGIGQLPGRIRFTSGLDTVNHALAEGERSDGSIEVPVSTLDTELPGERPFLVKIDVEGYETPVLAGATRTLGAPSLKAVIMEINGSGDRYGYDEEALVATMLGHGFRTYAYDPMSRALADLGGRPLGSGNTIFVRDEAEIAARIETAPLARVRGRAL